MQPLPNPVALQFSQDEDIDYAFIKLSAAVTEIIQCSNFYRLQRACIEKARTPKMLHKSNEIIPLIKRANSFEKLCFMLANTTYWNFLDIRMMEAMATASRIPAAQQTIENFKKTFFSITLKEAAPYFPVISVKPNHTELHEDLDRDPSQMTIGELHKHRFYLETEVLNTGPDTCTICRIKIGSVAIVWQIHFDYAYHIYSRLKKVHPQLLSKEICSMSIPEMKKWEGLPFLWRGQDVGEIGPIESSTCVRHEPHPLPHGLEWSILTASDIDEIIELQEFKGEPKVINSNFLKWITSSMHYKKGCLLGIRLSSSKILVCCIISVPTNIRIGRKLLSMVDIRWISVSAIFFKEINQLYIALIKETMRLLSYEGIFQAVITFEPLIPEPIITYDIYQWNEQLYPLPYTSPRTVGLRRMKQSDIPRAFALVNQYTSKFEIGQVFKSEKEFAHWFLSPLQKNLVTYVVEESDGGNITDMFSFAVIVSPKSYYISAVVTALIITKSPAKQLITDMLIFTKQHSAFMVTLYRFGLKEHLFVNFFRSSEGHGVLYNYIYPKVDCNNHCLIWNYMYVRK